MAGTGDEGMQRTLYAAGREGYKDGEDVEMLEASSGGVGQGCSTAPLQPTFFHD